MSWLGHPLLDATLNLALAFLLAMPVGWAREKGRHTAGLRSYPLMAVGTCAGTLLTRTGLASDLAAQAHAFQGIVGGVAILAAGALINDANQARGMNSAVSLWLTGAMGMGVGFGVPLLSVAVCLLALAALRLLRSAKQRSA